MDVERGKFIVIYGSNNIGKSTQANLLVERLISLGKRASYLKYPVYDLEPTGPRLDGILRRHTEILELLETQKIFTQNRVDYEPTLVRRLSGGEWIVAEDYRKTGIAWGITFGAPLEPLVEMNRNLYPEDLEICLDGERFASGIERGHLHEDGNSWEKNREIHRMLAKLYDWEIVNANGLKEKVAEDILHIVEKRLLRKN